jgi:hypothetical protein
MKKLSQLFFLALLIPSLCHGQGHERQLVTKSHAGTADLSPELQNLFSQEMRQLQQGMTEILPLYVSGGWAEIAVIAGKMEDSYVLKQNLSAKQMDDLHAVLPGEFITLDQQFHYLAGMLEQAAEMEKVELVGFYFSKMSEVCVSCHTQYATQRFPALAPKPEAHEH